MLMFSFSSIGFNRNYIFRLSFGKFNTEGESEGEEEALPSILFTMPSSI